MIQTLTTLTGESETSAKSTLLYLDLLMRDYFGAGSEKAVDLEQKASRADSGNDERKQ